jgi:hypothetical protein
MLWLRGINNSAEIPYWIFSAMLWCLGSNSIAEKTRDVVTFGLHSFAAADLL